MDDEVKGSKGTSYTTEYRQLDPRVGRWLSIDPKASSMPWQSPFCSMNNNPVFYSDPKGDIIVIGGNVEAYLALIKKAYNGKVEAEIVDGVLQIHKVEGAELTDFETNAFEFMNEAIDGPSVGFMNAVESSDAITGADYFNNSTLDLGDIEDYGNDESFLTTRAILVHEMIEAYEKSLLPIGIKETKEGFHKAHEIATRYESESGAIDRSVTWGGLKTANVGNGKGDWSIARSAWRIENGEYEKIVIYSIYMDNSLVDQVIERYDFTTEKLISVESQSGNIPEGYDSGQPFKDKE